MTEIKRMKYKPTFDSEWVEWPYWRGPTREECAEVEAGMPLFWSLDSSGTKERIYALQWPDGSEWHAGEGVSYRSTEVENNPQTEPEGIGYVEIRSGDGKRWGMRVWRGLDGKWHYGPLEPAPEPDNE